MKILIVVSHPESQDALVGLADTCFRRKQDYLCFFTGDGVKHLENSAVLKAVEGAERAVVCEHSWAKYFADQQAPIEEGSQTDHSAMVSSVRQVVSL